MKHEKAAYKRLCCEKTFTSRQSFNQHRRLVHSIEYNEAFQMTASGERGAWRKQHDDEDVKAKIDEKERVLIEGFVTNLKHKIKEGSDVHEDENRWL